MFLHQNLTIMFFETTLNVLIFKLIIVQLTLIVMQTAQNWFCLTQICYAVYICLHDRDVILIVLFYKYFSKLFTYYNYSTNNNNSKFKHITI